MGAPSGRSIKRVGGNDPGDRFAEVHACGCEYSAGQLLPCADHRAPDGRSLPPSVAAAVNAALDAVGFGDSPDAAWHEAREAYRMHSGALGDLDDVLHAAPEMAWKSVNAMRTYLLEHGVRVGGQPASSTAGGADQGKRRDNDAPASGPPA